MSQIVNSNYLHLDNHLTDIRLKCKHQKRQFSEKFYKGLTLHNMTKKQKNKKISVQVCVYNKLHTFFWIIIMKEISK